MTTRRGFIKGAIAAAVAAVLPGGEKPIPGFEDFPPTELATGGPFRLPEPNHTLGYYAQDCRIGESAWRHYSVVRGDGDIERCFIDGEEVPTELFPDHVVVTVDDAGQYGVDIDLPPFHLDELRVMRT